MPQFRRSRASLGVPVGRDGGVGPRSRGTGIRAIGIDEIHWQRGSQFLTLQIDTRNDRPATCQDPAPVLPLVDGSGPPRSLSSRWKAVVAKKAGHALHILDRFHIAKHMSDAIVRSAAPKSAFLGSS